MSVKTKAKEIRMVLADEPVEGRTYKVIRPFEAEYFRWSYENSAGMETLNPGFYLDVIGLTDDWPRQKVQVAQNLSHEGERYQPSSKHFYLVDEEVFEDNTYPVENQGELIRVRQRRMEALTDFPRNYEVAENVTDWNSAINFIDKYADRAKEWWKQLIDRLNHDDYDKPAGLLDRALGAIPLPASRRMKIDSDLEGGDSYQGIYRFDLTRVNDQYIPEIEEEMHRFFRERDIGQATRRGQGLWVIRDRNGKSWDDIREIVLDLGRVFSRFTPRGMSPDLAIEYDIYDKGDSTRADEWVEGGNILGSGYKSHMGAIPLPVSHSRRKYSRGK